MKDEMFSNQRWEGDGRRVQERKKEREKDNIDKKINSLYHLQRY
jgi:hypothetical protein